MASTTFVVDRERRMGFRAMEKGQVMLALFAQFGDESGISFGKAVAE